MYSLLLFATRGCMTVTFLRLKKESSYYELHSWFFVINHYCFILISAIAFKFYLEVDPVIHVLQTERRVLRETGCLLSEGLDCRGKQDRWRARGWSLFLACQTWQRRRRGSGSVGFLQWQSQHQNCPVSGPHCLCIRDHYGSTVTEGLILDRHRVNTDSSVTFWGFSFNWNIHFIYPFHFLIIRKPGMSSIYMPLVTY